MSTLKATYLQQASSASPNITLDASTNATVAGTLAMGSSFKRNRIINGDMRIAQRGTTAVTTTASFPVDRFKTAFSTDGAFTLAQDTSAPPNFNNSVKWTTTTADASLAGTQYALFRQVIEGNNVADLAFGSSYAKTITLSFWVRSSLTGTFAGSLLNSAQDRCYPYTYTISQIDTWEYKTITIPGDTTGTWLKDTGIGFDMFWSLGVGSTYSGTAGAWTSTPNIYSVTGSVSVIGTLNATWYITGVQLEVGSIATPYERQIYSDQLAQCQRYYYKVTNYALGIAGFVDVPYRGSLSFPVSMRVAPSIDSGATYSVSGGSAGTVAAFNITGATTTVDQIPLKNSAANWTTGNAVAVNAGFSAEL